MTPFFVAAAAAVCLTPQPGPIAGLVWTCVGGGWQPLPVAPVSQTLTSETLPSPYDMPAVCTPGLNPYTDPVSALECALASIKNQKPAKPLRQFVVGETYRSVYGDAEIIVLNVTRTIEGKTVVTAQYTKEDQRELIGTVLAFILSPESGQWLVRP